MPNITGELKNLDTNSGGQFLTDVYTDKIRQLGALTVSNSGVARQAISNGGDASKNIPDIINFDASLSSSIYGNNEHVTPNNVSIRIWQRIS